MSRVVLDTCAYSAMGKGHRGIMEQVRNSEQIIISPIVLGEVKLGYLGGHRRNENERNLVQFLSNRRVTVPKVDEETAGYFAEILHGLRRAGRPIPINDVWICASAMQHGARVVTTDKHFLQVPQVLVDYHEPVQ